MRTYRILHAILNTAVDEDLIRRNPCRIKGAWQEKSEERPTASLAQVFAIVDAIQPRYRLLVLPAAFGQLRFGELVALRRNSINVEAMELKLRCAGPRWPTALRSTTIRSRPRASARLVFPLPSAPTSRST